MLEPEASSSDPQVNLAIALANVLKFELHYDQEKKWYPPHDNVLYNDVPSREDPIFKRGRGAIKEKLSRKLESGPGENECRRLFCLAHGEFVLPSDAEIEHVYPYGRFKENQKRLLCYLNAEENTTFKHTFLSQPGISLYFRKNSDGIVKASNFFYYRCYVEMDNLFLLCHACNLHKSKIEPEAWFRTEDGYFGEPFLDVLEDKGGLHEGVLFERVYKSCSTDPALVFKNGRVVKLPIRGSKGLGDVMSGWFFERFQPVFEEHKAYYNDNY